MKIYLLAYFAPLLWYSSAQPSFTAKLVTSNALIGQNSFKNIQHSLEKRYIGLRNDSGGINTQEMAQSEDEKKERRMLIRKKRKRYRRLRKEMREIENFLEANGFKRVNMTKGEKSGKCKANCDWRKRFSVKWKRLDKRVKKLEAWRRNADLRKTIQEYDMFGRPEVGRNPGALNSTTMEQKFKDSEGPTARLRKAETSVEQTERDRQFKQLVSSRNQSLNGESGRPCKAHQDCQPGLCCHRSYYNSSASRCVDHNLSEDQFCKDSCQCRAQLHCIQSKNPAEKATSGSPTQGVCKKLSEKNFFNSTNLDAKTLVFVDGQPS